MQNLKTVTTSPWATAALSQGYAPDYDIRMMFDRAEAAEESLAVYMAHASQDSFTVEVKCDYRAGETGNIYFETSCKNKPSGIYSTKADWFTLMMPSWALLTFPTWKLREFIDELDMQLHLADAGLDEAPVGVRRGSTNKDPRNSTTGILVPVETLVNEMLTKV